jgi:hypothetical protein
MWDYQVGLVRITPFFKALKFSKVSRLPVSSSTVALLTIHCQTTPAKAITANPGLQELSHSITGGALAAQGYWMPYHCAKALCRTFCWKIRWALTPLFGPGFIKECLPEGHNNYRGFKISPALVEHAREEAKRMRAEQSSRNGTLVEEYEARIGAYKEVPRSLPPPPTSAPKEVRARPAVPSFKLGSPFQSEYNGSASDGRSTHAPSESPKLSPKSTFKPAFTSPGWTSINRHHTASPVHSLTGTSSLLLTEPCNVAPTTSWRSLEPAPPLPPSIKPAPSVGEAHDTPRIPLKRTRKPSRPVGNNVISQHPRRVSTQSDSDEDGNYNPSSSRGSDGSSSRSSESNAADLVLQSFAGNVGGRKRVRREENVGDQRPQDQRSPTPTKLISEEDAANILLGMRKGKW